jgi:hypothetical protein
MYNDRDYALGALIRHCCRQGVGEPCLDYLRERRPGFPTLLQLLLEGVVDLLRLRTLGFSLSGGNGEALWTVLLVPH